MNIEDIKTLLELVVKLQNEKPKESHFKIGKVYFIRTVTYHLTGRIKHVGEKELVISEAAWIADSGRFADALQNEEFNEVEPFPKGSEIIVGRQAIVDAVWISEPQISQK